MRHWKVFLASALILGFADCVPAQTGLTSLRGTVTDPAGALVPGAQAELKNNATGFHATTKTDSNGAHEFPQIAPGRFTITVTMTGFAAQSKQAELLVSQPATINFILSIQESKSVVEVTSEAQTINATDASIGNSVSNATVESLPMEGRNVPDLLSLQPGVLYLGQKFNNISSSNRDTDSRRERSQGRAQTSRMSPWMESITTTRDRVMLSRGFCALHSIPSRSSG